MAQTTQTARSFWKNLDSKLASERRDPKEEEKEDKKKKKKDKKDKKIEKNEKKSNIVIEEKKNDKKKVNSLPKPEKAPRKTPREIFQSYRAKSREMFKSKKDPNSLRNMTLEMDEELEELDNEDYRPRTKTETFFENLRKSTDIEIRDHPRRDSTSKLQGKSQKKEPDPEKRYYWKDDVTPPATDTSSSLDLTADDVKSIRRECKYLRSQLSKSQEDYETRITAFEGKTKELLNQLFYEVSKLKSELKKVQDAGRLVVPDNMQLPVAALPYIQPQPLMEVPTRPRAGSIRSTSNVFVLSLMIFPIEHLGK